MDTIKGYSLDISDKSKGYKFTADDFEGLSSFYGIKKISSCKLLYSI